MFFFLKDKIYEHNYSNKHFRAFVIHNGIDILCIYYN